MKIKFIHDADKIIFLSNKLRSKRGMYHTLYVLERNETTEVVYSGNGLLFPEIMVMSKTAKLFYGDRT